MMAKTKNGQMTPLVSANEKISIQLIDDFPNHSYYVFDDEDIFELIESIRKNGLISPLIVRKKNDRFELISGHRRKRACGHLGNTEIPCTVINASNDEAIIMMVDSNCQRKKILSFYTVYFFPSSIFALDNYVSAESSSFS